MVVVVVVMLVVTARVCGGRERGLVVVGTHSTAGAKPWYSWATLGKSRPSCMRVLTVSIGKRKLVQSSAEVAMDAASRTGSDQPRGRCCFSLAPVPKVRPCRMPTISIVGALEGQESVRGQGAVSDHGVCYEIYIIYIYI